MVEVSIIELVYGFLVDHDVNDLIARDCIKSVHSDMWQDVPDVFTFSSVAGVSNGVLQIRQRLWIVGFGLLLLLIEISCGFISCQAPKLIISALTAVLLLCLVLPILDAVNQHCFFGSGINQGSKAFEENMLSPYPATQKQRWGTRVSTSNCTRPKLHPNTWISDRTQGGYILPGQNLANHISNQTTRLSHNLVNKKYVWMKQISLYTVGSIQQSIYIIHRKNIL